MKNDDGIVGDLNWGACETCVHGPEEGGCDIEDKIELDFMEYTDNVTCMRYEKRGE